MARLIGQRLGTILGQTIVVDNRPGAGGTIGARSVAEADPDGYTLLLGNTSTLVIGPLIYRTSTTPDQRTSPAVALLGTDLQSAGGDARHQPAKSVRDGCARQGDRRNSISPPPGIRDTAHLIGETLQAEPAGVDIVHVPYKDGRTVAAGGGCGRNASLPSRTTTIALPLAQAGTGKGLAVTMNVKSARVRFADDDRRRACRTSRRMSFTAS